MDEMTEIFDPANLAAFLYDAVLHIVKIKAAVCDLCPNAFLYVIPILRMHQPAKGISCALLEVLHGVTIENPQKSLIGIENLFVVGAVNQKAAGHLINQRIYGRIRFF